MYDIFAGHNVRVFTNGNEVKELSEYPSPITVCNEDSVNTKVELVINYTQDNVLDRLVYSNKSFYLSIDDSVDGQLIHSGWFRITKRVITGEHNTVVRGHYTLESIHFSYPFSNMPVNGFKLI